MWLVPGDAVLGHDPLLGLPLFLRADIAGGTLWALNLDHLESLEAYLGATLRERPAGVTGLTMMARLPRWMKLAANRPKVLQGLAEMRSMALAAGIA